MAFRVQLETFRNLRETGPGSLYEFLCSDLMEKVSFSGSKTRLQFRAVNENICSS